VFVPKGDGVGIYAQLPSEQVIAVGVRQPPGASGRATPLGRMALIARIVAQGVALRVRRSFRGAEVVHANTSRAALIGWIATAGSRRRLIVHLRDEVSADSIGKFGFRGIKFVLGRADGVIANSAFTLSTAASFLPEHSPRAVIASSIGLDRHREPIQVRPQVLTIGMLARLSDWKGQGLLIEAFAKAFRGTGIVLELAGSPAFGNEQFLVELQALAHQLGVGTQVRFLGHVEDIWTLLTTWDIGVQASTRPEPLGQNVLQYLAVCLPTIAADIGGPTEWIVDGHNGLLFSSGDSDSLSDALKRLVADAELRTSIHGHLERQRPVPLDGQIQERYSEFFYGVAASASS